MSLRNSLIQSKKNNDKEKLESLINSLGLSRDFFCEPYDLLINYWNIFRPEPNEIPDHKDGRFSSFVSFWKSKSFIEGESYWMAHSCFCENATLLPNNSPSLNDKFFPVLMEEYYNEENILNSLMWNKGIDNVKQNTQLMHSIDNEVMFIHVLGHSAIAYVHAESREFCEDRYLTHPYATSFSTHELFKLLLEWQWARRELGSSEPVAVLADEFLSIFGLDYSDSQNKVVSDLLNLPDQQVAQYIKTGSITVNELSPACPQSFHDWLASVGDVFSLIKYRANSLI